MQILYTQVVLKVSCMVDILHFFCTQLLPEGKQYMQGIDSTQQPSCWNVLL